MRHRVDGVRHLISRILHRRRWVTNQDAEDGDENYYTFAWESPHVSAFHEDWDKIPDMEDRIYLLICAAPGPGNTHWNHYGKTPEEVLENCLRQTVACVLAAVNEEYEEWKRQLKAGRLEKLLDLPKDFFTDGRVEDALRARERRPTDVPRHRGIREEVDRLNRATRAAAGVSYVKGPGGPELVVRKDGKRFSLDQHEAAVEYALNQSSTLRARHERQEALKRYAANLELQSPSDGGDASVASGTARRMCMGFIDDMTQKLSMGGISVPLIASKEDCLEHLCVGFKPNTLSTAVWKSNSELGYPENYCGGNLASMAWNLRAIEHMLLRGRRRVDGVGRPKFDFHTGRRKKRSSSASSARKRRRIRFRWRGRKLRSGGPGAKLRRSGCSNARHPSQVLTSLVSRSKR